MPLKSLKWYKNCATKKGRLEAGAFLVEGDRAIKQIITTHPDEIIEIIAIEKPSPEYHNYSIRYVTNSQFRSISQTRTPQGTIAVVRLPRNTFSDYLPDTIGTKILLLEDIQDPGNVGTLIRTDPLSQKCIQSTAGAILSVWIRKTAHYLEFVEKLKKIGYSLIAADLKGMKDPSMLYCQDKLLLALGNEASGLSESILNVSNHRLQIPIIRQQAESLNVAACGAICMYLSSCK
ncbi:MAG: RNA methyltransferase [Deltaproteobacteria bacterium]|nr:RNA methyltransferase [Deltaproteobacteria bacterium]